MPSTISYANLGKMIDHINQVTADKDVVKEVGTLVIRGDTDGSYDRIIDYIYKSTKVELKVLLTSVRFAVSHSNLSVYEQIRLNQMLVTRLSTDMKKLLL